MIKTSDAVWTQIDPNSLDDHLGLDYIAYKEAYAKAKALKQRFEENMTKAAELPRGKRMIFGYNFGKLSVAIVNGEREATKPQAKTQSLAQFLAQQAASGRAA